MHDADIINSIGMQIEYLVEKRNELIETIKEGDTIIVFDYDKLAKGTVVSKRFIHADRRDIVPTDLHLIEMNNGTTIKFKYIECKYKEG